MRIRRREEEESSISVVNPHAVNSVNRVSYGRASAILRPTGISE